MSSLASPTNSTAFSPDQKEYLTGLFAGIAARGVGFRDVAANPAGDAKAAPDDLIFEERVKRELHPLDAYQQLLDNAATNKAPDKAPDKEDTFRFKWNGLFFLTPVKDAFMARLRIPGGVLKTFQLRELAHIARDLTTGYVQITTRANLQVRLIAPKDTPEFLRRVQSVGLHTRGAGADNIRNLTANPTSGVDPVELIDVMPFVHELAQVIINERAFYDLPRKFNIAFDGGGLIGSVEDTNDIGVKAVKVGEKLAELMRAWRNRCKLSRVQAAHALRSTGLRTMARTVWTWETARALPQRPMAVLDLIHGPLAVNPPKPKAAIMEPRQFAALLSRWRRGLRMTQAQASAELGLPPDQSLICDYERGNAFPRPERIRAILDAIASRPAPPPPPRIRPSPFARGLTLARAAAILGCPVATLCKYEHGRSEPPAHRRAPILAIID